MLHQIPEETIKKLAEDMNSYQQTNTFNYLLQLGGVYKENGLTPAYLWNAEKSNMYVTSEERLEKKFH